MQLTLTKANKSTVYVSEIPFLHFSNFHIWVRGYLWTSLYSDPRVCTTTTADFQTRSISWQRRLSKAKAVLSQRTRIIEKTSVIYIWAGWMWANCTQRPLSLIFARWTVTVDCNSHDLALCMDSYVQEWWYLNKSFFSDFRSKMNVFTKLSIGALTLCHLAFGFGLVFKVLWPSQLPRTPLIFFRWPPSTTLQGF